MSMESLIEDIRNRLRVRMDADEQENENANENAKKKPVFHGNTRLPYGLCKGEGIGTEGMTPKEAWEAYYSKTGVSPSEAYKKHFKGESGSADKETAGNDKTAKTSKLSGLKTVSEMRDYMESEHGIKVSDKFEKKIKSETGLNNFRNALETIERRFGESPEFAARIGEVRVASGSTVFAVGHGFTGADHKDFFMINPEAMEDLDEKCKKHSEDGFWPKNTNLDSLIEHESAHAMVNWIRDHCGDYSVGMWTGSIFEAAKKNLVEKAIVSQACKDVKKTDFGKGKKNAELKESISRYAMSDESETLAEAFGDCKANGDNASPLSKRIKELTLQKVEEVKKKLTEKQKHGII